MRRLAFAAGGVALAAVAGVFFGFVHQSEPPLPVPEAETLVFTDILSPPAMPAGIVFLLSGADGWGRADRRMARKLAESGAIVVGVDLPKSFAKAEASTDDCVYFISDVEAASQQLQRAAGVLAYKSPVIAGRGVGAGFALALASQTPDATIGRTVAVDPTASVPLAKEFCTDAAHEKAADGRGWTYGLDDGPLPDPIEVIDTPKADAAGKAHVAALVAKGFAIATRSVPEDSEAALVAAAAKTLDRGQANANDPVAGLPLTVMPAAASSDVIAIVVSGDGGWRDLDSEIAKVLVEKGVPTVGVDSLRYFWSEKQPATVAADIARIVDRYGKAWGARRVALIGYSFGADVLPAAYLALSPEIRERVALVSLLAPSLAADFQFQLSGLLGLGGDDGRPTLPDIRAMPPAIVQCFYGTEDTDDSACPKLAGTGVQVVRTEGGHHFDGDYAPIAAAILARLR